MTCTNNTATAARCAGCSGSGCSKAASGAEDTSKASSPGEASPLPIGSGQMPASSGGQATAAELGTGADRGCRITLPWPPSVNTMWRTPRTGPLAGRTLLSEDGRKYREAVSEQCLLQAVRKFDAGQRLAVTIVAYPPDRRSRDLDNLLKAPLDALTHAGVWGDDSQIDSITIRRAHIGGMLEVRVEVMA